MRSCDNESIQKYNRHLTPTNFGKELVLEFNLVPQVIIIVCGSFKNIFFPARARVSGGEDVCGSEGIGIPV